MLQRAMLSVAKSFILISAWVFQIQSFDSIVSVVVIIAEKELQEMIGRMLTIEKRMQNIFQENY